MSQEDPTYTRRRYLIIKALTHSIVRSTPFLAAEAVATTALEHPEWDMDEEATWDEWETRR